jgi:hypothetical protein
VPTGFAIPQPFGRGGGGGGRGGAGGRGADSTARPAAAPATPPPAPVTVPLPTSMAVLGPVFQDEKSLLVAHAFQAATDFHRKHPPQFG